MEYYSLSEVWGQNNDSIEKFSYKNSIKKNSSENFSDANNNTKKDKIKENKKEEKKIKKKNKKIIKKNNKKIIKKNNIKKIIKKNKKCNNCDLNIEKIMNCKSCLNKIKKKLKIKNNKKENLINNIIDENRDLIVMILIGICVILLIDIFKNKRESLNTKYYYYHPSLSM